MATRHGTKGLAGVLLVAAVMAMPHTVWAEDWKPTGMFGWLGVGAAYQIESDHIFWVGAFSGTFFKAHAHHAPLLPFPKASRESTGLTTSTIPPVGVETVYPSPFRR